MDLGKPIRELEIVPDSNPVPAESDEPAPPKPEPVKEPVPA